MLPTESFMGDLATAIRNREPFPQFPEGLTLDDAFDSLYRLAALVCDERTAGIKAGLTNPEIQKLFGLDSPLLGYLYDCGQRQVGDSIASHKKGQIECEIGIVLDEEGRPKSLAPAIEFVRVDFSEPSDFTPPNLVLTNLGADQFLLGQELDWEEKLVADLKDLAISLKRNGEEILSTTAGTSLGGPKGAVEWCVGEARNRGLRFSARTVLLAGTCGSGMPLEAGEYVADYSSLGKIEFQVC